MKIENSLSCLSEASYRQIFNSDPRVQIIVETDFPLYTVRDVNLAGQDLLRRKKNELSGRSIRDIFPFSFPEAQPHSTLETLIGTGKILDPAEIYAENSENKLPDAGRSSWICTSTPLPDFNHGVRFLLLSLKEISQPQETTGKVTEKLKAFNVEHRELKSLIMQAPFGIALFKGSEYRIEMMNQVFADITGKSYAEMIGLPVFSVLDSVKDQGFKELLDSVVKTGQSLSVAGAEVPLLRNGKISQVYLNYVYSPYKEANGTISGVFAIAFDVTEEVKNKLNLQQSEEKFRFLSECLPQQVWTINESGNVDFINDYTQQYFKENNLREDIKEWRAGSGNWFKYIHAEDLQKVSRSWAQANDTAALFKATFRLQRGDGDYRWHRAMALPVVSGNKIVKWLGTNTDIDDIKQIEDRKDEFISMASHELKTPMTSLKGYMQLISNNVSDEKNRLYIDRGLIQIGRIEKLIADLLDVSKITTGKIHYNMACFDFHDLIDETVQNFKLTNSTHLLMLVNNANITIYGDRYRFEQVLINFLSNAVKYSPNAGTIRMKSIVKNGELVVSIQDFGIGINKSHQSRLYERFYRVDKTAILFSGLGLGLYVSSEIIHRHKGSFWYESTLGSGSEFYFSLPAEVLSCPVPADLPKI